MNHALNYWWLVFPLAGIFGWRGKNSRSRRRHDIDPHQQPAAPGYDPLTSGQNAPAYQYAAPTYQPAPAVDPAQQRAAAVGKMVAEHDSINARWLAYELDVGKMIDFPMMSDVREPLTVDFLRAKRTADALRPDQPQQLATDPAAAEYRTAVHAYGMAFDIAEREAKRLKDRNYSEDERSHLGRARKLTAMAEDEAATPAERQSAYKRVQKELDGLLVLPDATLAELERRVQGIIAAHPTGQATAPSTAQPTAPARERPTP